jgi:hypothetical protein
MTDGARGRLSFHPRLMVLAGVLTAVSLGLPWVARPRPLDGVPVGGVGSGGELPGFSHPVRVIALVAAVLLWWAVRQGSRRIAVAACLVAVTALPLGLTQGVSSGRICFALAIVAAVVAIWRTPVATPR